MHPAIKHLRELSEREQEFEEPYFSSNYMMHASNALPVLLDCLEMALDGLEDFDNWDCLDEITTKLDALKKGGE